MQIRFFTTIFVSLVTFISAAQNFSVSEPMTVASGYGNYHPQIEVMGDGELGMIWTNSSTNSLYFCKRNGLNTFDVPVKLNPDGTEVQDYNWSGPDLCAQDSLVYVAYHDYGFETGHIYLVKSTDYGASFGDTIRVDNLPGTDYAQFPDIAVHNDTLYVVFMSHGLVTMNPQMMLTRSFDGGQTFEPAVDASTWMGEEACDCCQPELIVNDEHVIIYFRRNASNVREIKGLISYDRGATFNEMYSPDDHNWNISACPSSGPDARFLPNGNAVCIYRTNDAGTGKLFLNEYDVSNDIELNEIQISDASSSNTGINYPQIASDGSMFGIVWEALGSNTDVFFNATSTGFSSLSSSNTINISNISGSQSKPDIAILNGSFHIIYSELAGAEVKYVRVTSITSVVENKGAFQISVYPNPATEFITIDAGMQENATVEIMDFSGKVVIETYVTTTNDQLDVSDLSSGLYLLKISGEDFTQTLSWVKE